VLSPSGTPAEVSCIGAQFVACLDFRVSGGLVGELLVGASALFVRMEDGRAVLLRTTPIEHVEFRRPAEIVDPKTAPLSGSFGEDEIDVEDLSTYSSEVTRTMPLYRPQVHERDPRPPSPFAEESAGSTVRMPALPVAPEWPSGWGGNNRR
jgi:hypothetical protein